MGDPNLQNYLCQWSCFDLVWVFETHICLVRLCHPTSTEDFVQQNLVGLEKIPSPWKTLLHSSLVFLAVNPRIKAPVKFARKVIPRKKVLTIFYVFIPGDVWVLAGWLCHCCHSSKSTVSNAVFIDSVSTQSFGIVPSGWKQSLCCQAISVLSRLLGHDTNPGPSPLTRWVSSTLWASVSCTNCLNLMC